MPKEKVLACKTFERKINRVIVHQGFKLTQADQTGAHYIRPHQPSILTNHAFSRYISADHQTPGIENIENIIEKNHSKVEESSQEIIQ